MKKLLFLSSFVLIAGLVFSQNPLPVGKTQLNLGVGLSGWGVPIYIGFDHGIHRDFTLGAEASFRSYNENWKNNRYRHNITGISGNANYHLNNALEMSKVWDLYVGANIGFFVWNSPDNYDGNHSSGLGLGAQIGTRYYVSNKVGLNLEFGGGNAFSGGKFGVTIKL